MTLQVSRVVVWAVDVPNQPGTLARVMEALRDAGANLEFVIARRVTEETSRIFVAPLKGAKVLRAARAAGLAEAAGMHALRLETPDRLGLGAELARALADRGLNIRGFSAAAVKKQCLCYIAFESESDATAAAKILKKLAPAAKKR